MSPVRPVAVAYLVSHTLSLLGNGIAAVALPLIVLQITGSPASVGAMAAATAVPSLLVGLAAGLVLDRFNRRTFSALADVVSAVSVAAIPVVDLLWGLDLWWLIGLAIVGAFGDVPGLTARQVLVPAIARHTGMSLERLVGLRQATTSMALVVGPAAAGALLAVFDGSTVLFVTAATSGVAALLTLAVPHRYGRIEAVGERTSVWTELTAGARVLRRSRFLSGTVALMLGLTFVIGGLQGLVLPVYFTTIARPDLLGFVLTALAAGMFVGTTGYATVGGRGRRGIWVGVALIGTTAGLLTISTLVSPLVVLVGAALLGVSNALVGAILGVLQAECTPEATRGRVLSLQNSLLTVAAPAGIALAGVVAEVGSPVAAGVAVVAVWIAVLLAVVVSGALRNLEPVRSVADAPSGDQQWHGADT